MTTAVAVTGVVIVGGGVAGATQFRPDAGHQQEADAEAARFADSQAAQDIAARNAASGVVNRDATRPPLVAVTTPTPRDLQQVEIFSAGTAMPAVPTAAAGTTGAPAGASTPSTAPSSTAGTPATAASSPSASPSTSKTTPTTKPAPTTAASTTAQGYNATPAQARAIAQQLVPTGQFACFDNIITRESSWNLHATNASSGAYGLAQALPGSKMAETGADWRNNAVTQIKWALGYMTSRYGSPCAAWSFWQTHHWY